MLWQLLEEDVSGSMQDQYVWSPVYIDALIERDTPTQRMYVEQDANFNVTALVDTTGNVQERYVYDPFGSVSILAANWTTRGSSNYGWVYFHQGGRFDFATGLYAFRNRDYSSTLGRWVENDPIGFAGGDPNLYRYVGNDPTSSTDSYGLQFLPHEPALPLGRGPKERPRRPPGWGPQPAQPGGTPPPGAPGVGVPGNRIPDNPGGIYYFPPDAYNTTTRKVLIMTNYTSDDAKWCWVPDKQQHTGTTGDDQLRAILNGYADHSIDLLIFDGHAAPGCACWTRKGDKFGAKMDDGLWQLVIRKLSPNAKLMIAGCRCAANFGAIPPIPNPAKEAYDKYKIPFVACPAATWGPEGKPGIAGGGYGNEPWQQYPPVKKDPSKK
jgi:RHS repeat-associated protein